ncbi:MAG: ribonuclease E/G [Pseudomonadota bacterium]
MLDGRLEDLILHPPKGSNLPSAGDICVVRVTRKLPKSGAFCEMAGGGEGYLRDAKSVRQGERILTQVVSLPEPGKAVTLTTRLLIKGPRLILTPGARGINVSRKIGNSSERERLEETVRAARAANRCTPNLDAMGVIIRTAARDEGAIELAREYDCLVSTWSRHMALLRDHNAVKSDEKHAPLDYALREWLFPRPNAILCGPGLARSLSYSDDIGPPAFFGDGSYIRLIETTNEPFSAAGVHEAIDALKLPVISLGSASMSVESTRALVAIDVNTHADFSPAAGLKANLDAATELPRQLRLRGLGGQIAVDFAAMPKQQRRTLEEALKKAFRHDWVETSLVGWTGLGLYELQRKRERRPLTEVL